MKSATESTATPEFPPEVPLNAVILGQKIGSGDFGTVKFGLWNSKPVAVKIQNNDGTAVSEAAMLWNLSHPNIVLLFAITGTKAKFVMILEKMDMDLFDYLQENRPLEKKIGIAKQVM